MYNAPPTTDVKPTAVEGAAAGVAVRGGVAGRAVLLARIAAGSETSWMGRQGFKPAFSTPWVPEGCRKGAERCRSANEQATTT